MLPIAIYYSAPFTAFCCLGCGLYYQLALLRYSAMVVEISKSFRLQINVKDMFAYFGLIFKIMDNEISHI